MALCASFAKYRSEQSFIDGAENGFGIDGMYVSDGATGPSMAILAGEDMDKGYGLLEEAVFHNP